MGQMQQNFGQNQYLKVIIENMRGPDFDAIWAILNNIQISSCFIGIDEKLSTTRWR